MYNLHNFSLKMSKVLLSCTWWLICLWHSLMFDYTERRAFQQVEAHAGTDVFVVLVPTLKVVHVCRQVRVYKAEACIVKHKSHGHSSFIPLWGNGVTNITDLILSVNICLMIYWLIQFVVNDHIISKTNIDIDMLLLSECPKHFLIWHFLLWVIHTYHFIHKASSHRFWSNLSYVILVPVVDIHHQHHSHQTNNTHLRTNK